MATSLADCEMTAILLFLQQCSEISSIQCLRDSAYIITYQYQLTWGLIHAQSWTALFRAFSSHQQPSAYLNQSYLNLISTGLFSHTICTEGEGKFTPYLKTVWYVIEIFWGCDVMKTMMTLSKSVNPYNSMQLFLNTAKCYFQFALLLFQRHL